VNLGIADAEYCAQLRLGRPQAVAHDRPLDLVDEVASDPQSPQRMAEARAVTSQVRSVDSLAGPANHDPIVVADIC
jgi:hypothetical protein